MNTTIFLTLLSAFSVISGLLTEGIKNLIKEKSNLSSNLLALAASLIIGSTGSAAYYQLNGIPFTLNNIICIGLMGFASALVSMVGYDKVKQAIHQFSSIAKQEKEDV